MKELAMDIVKENKRGILAKVELEKMMGCKLVDMTDEQKKLGLACLLAFENQWNVIKKGCKSGFVFESSRFDRLLRKIKNE